MALLTLASCNTPSPRVPSGPTQPPKAEALDPRLCAEVEPTPTRPAGATVVQPATIEERTATSLFVAWVADLVDVATANQDRAELARAECQKRR